MHTKIRYQKRIQEINELLHITDNPDAIYALAYTMCTYYEALSTME